MNLLKTSALNGVATLVKLATSLGLNKVLAVYVGPSGYAVIGQFQNIVSMVCTFASGAVNVGVTKYTAEFATDRDRQLQFWRTAAMLGLIGACLFSALLLIFRTPLAAWALGDAGLSGVIVWLSVSIFLLVLNGLMLAILNGLKAIHSLILANIVGSLASALCAGLLVSTWGLYGALVALALSQAVAVALTAWLFRRAAGVNWSHLVGRIDADVAGRLGRFGLMTLTTAIVTPTAQILMRNSIVSGLGWDAAGLWQALWKISETHLMLLTTTLSVYFLPRFSEIGRSAELKAEVLKGYRFVLVLVIASATLIYLARRPLIELLLSPKFAPLAEVLGVQLAGDVLKIGSWVVAYTMISHARTRAYIVTEIAFAALLVGCTAMFCKQWGLIGAPLAYATTYGLYWIVVHRLFLILTRRLPGNSSSALPAPKTVAH